MRQRHPSTFIVILAASAFGALACSDAGAASAELGEASISGERAFGDAPAAVETAPRSAESSDAADHARAIMEHNRAESVDAARDRWWIGIRDAEAERYCTESAEESAEREKIFRAGFEAALRPDMRNKPLNKARTRLRQQYPGMCEREVFQRGYERGRRHLRSVQRNGNGAGSPS